jgi:hypothetical protein
VGVVGGWCLPRREGVAPPPLWGGGGGGGVEVCSAEKVANSLNYLPWLVSSIIKEIIAGV